MVDSTSNDNEFTPNPTNQVDANGQAALLLVESLIHGLIARDVLPVSDAVEIVGSATDIAHLLGEAPATRRTSHTLLSAIQHSLSHDLPGERQPT